MSLQCMSARKLMSNVAIRFPFDLVTVWIFSIFIYHEVFFIFLVTVVCHHQCKG